MQSVMTAFTKKTARMILPCLLSPHPGQPNAARRSVLMSKFCWIIRTMPLYCYNAVADIGLKALHTPSTGLSSAEQPTGGAAAVE